MKRPDGFTLIEMLVSAGLIVVLLGALGGAISSSSRAYRAEEQNVTRLQDRQAAAATLAYDVSLAGYRGSSNAEYTAASSVALTPFVIVPSSVATESDQITVKYYEDRVFGSESKSIKTVVFSVNPLTSKLIRTQDGVTDEVASDVKRLKVAQYITKGATGSDCAIACSALPPAQTIGVILSVTFTDNSVMRVPISFSNSVL